jgi:uncharacterized cupin superfamily protein
MPKIEIAAANRRVGTRYPKPFDAPCLACVRHQLGDLVGLSQFGVNLLRLPPGALEQPASLALQGGRVHLGGRG